MTIETKYFFYKIIQDGNILLMGSNQDLSKTDKDCISIEESHHIECCEGLKNGKLLWLDKKGNLQVRDRLTKYDKKTDTWIPDQDAIDADNAQQESSRQEQLKIQAKQDLTDTSWMVDTDTLAEYSEAEQTQILAYRKYLREIMAGKIDLTEVIKLKTITDF